MMVSIEVDGYSVTAASLPLPSRGDLRVRRRVCDHPRRWDRRRPRGRPPLRPPPKKNPRLAVNSNLDTFGAPPCLDKPPLSNREKPPFPTKHRDKPPVCPTNRACGRNVSRGFSEGFS
jgi:hypothetical protein